LFQIKGDVNPRPLLLKKSSAQEEISVLRAMLERINDGVCIINQNYQLVTYNHAFMSMLGYTNDEMYSLFIWDFDHTLSEQKVRDTYPSFANTQATFQTVHKRKNNDTYIAQITAAGTNVLGESMVLCIVRDITEQEVLKNSLLEFKSTVDKASDCVFMFDPHSLLFTYVNEGALRHVGYTSDALYKMHPYDIKPEFGREAFTQLIQPLVKHREPSLKFKTIHRHKDGHDINVSINLQLVESELGAAKFIAIVHDITEETKLKSLLESNKEALEKEVENRTRQLVEAKEKAESANMAKSRFLANMSHEIRTPITSILGFSDLLKRESLSPSQQQAIKKISTASEHLLGLLSSVLDMSKIESGTYELKEQTVDVKKLIDEAIILNEERLASKGLQISVELPHVLPTYVGDITALLQGVINYVSNAIKYTDKGGVIVRASIVRQYADKDELRFEVEDTGIGIDASAMEKIFEPFEQADTSFGRKYGGIGIGLSITKKIAALYEGDAGVKSTLGSGSTFWFTCVLKRNNQQKEGDDRALDSESLLTHLHTYCADKNVLVVDDEKFNLALLEQILGDVAQLTVKTASNGQQAIALVQEQSFDMVFMDIQMPIMDGIEATKAIRECVGKDTLPIIALTGNIFLDVNADEFERLFNDVISKPFKVDDLLSKTLTLLTTHSQ